MWPQLLLLWQALSSCVAQGPSFLHDTRPLHAPPEIDCPLRRLVLEFSGQLADRATQQHVADALQMARLCNSSVASSHARPAAQPATSRRPGPRVVVDPTRGTDTNRTTGSAAAFRTVEAGLAYLRRTRGAGPGTLSLRGGVHYLKATLVLGPADSGLRIEAYNGEQATLSGGRLLRPKFRRHAGKVLVADQIAGNFSALFVAGSEQRLIRARHPNVNAVETQWPDLYLDPRLIPSVTVPNPPPGSKVGWMPPPSWMRGERRINITEPNWDDDGGLPPGMHFTQSGWMSPYYEAVVGGAMNRFVGSINPGPERTNCYQGCAVPGGTFFNPQAFSNSVDPANWTDLKTGVIHVVHPLTYKQGDRFEVPWYNWQFELDSYSSPGQTNLSSFPGLVFGAGGFQAAQGALFGSTFFVENILELLDSPGEWYHSKTSQKLYYIPNGTVPTEMVGAELKTLIRLKGSQQTPVRDVSVVGLSFMHVAADFLEGHEVPGGGDQAVPRCGAIIVEGAEHVQISNCTFNSVDGNGVMISRYNLNVTVSANEFVKTGSAGVVLMGKATLIDGTAGDFPRGTVVESNVIRDGGVYSKNYLGGSIFQALAAETVIRANIVFNTPRSCLTFNDNFGGGDSVERNLLFNCNRESSDTGNIYTYNRLPFLTNVRDGRPSLIPATRRIHHNLFLLNYGSNWAIDHDDGSSFYDDYSNVHLYSGTKHSTFTNGGHSKQIHSNLFLFPDVVVGQFQAQPYCATGHGFFERWVNNTCVMLNLTTPYSDGCPWVNINSTEPLRANNSFLLPSGSLKLQCGSQIWSDLASAQQHGQELGTTVRRQPPIAEIVQMARRMLELT